ncbi:hypothetical protein NDK43_10795 [Neobacillus pocheonensis]|uniref:Uncharacterized protein n=1 Tax=Neobacillus pocheonensis TaxID=363869 RepID=A0ABT0W8Y3_9BACI|nr:hypothetical protein [Neobacillus pocheonensis]
MNTRTKWNTKHKERIDRLQEPSPNPKRIWLLILKEEPHLILLVVLEETVCSLRG